MLVVRKDIDVLFGRGAGTNHHDGNIFWRNEVKKRRNRYRNSPNPTKEKIALEVIEEVMNRGGRFLKYSKETKTFEQASNERAIRKTQQRFRDSMSDKSESVNPKESNKDYMPGKVNLKEPNECEKIASGSSCTPSYPTNMEGISNLSTEGDGGSTDSTDDTFDEMVLSIDPIDSTDDTFDESLSELFSPEFEIYLDGLHNVSNLLNTWNN